MRNKATRSSFFYRRSSFLMRSGSKLSLRRDPLYSSSMKHTASANGDMAFDPIICAWVASSKNLDIRRFLP